MLTWEDIRFRKETQRIHRKNNVSAWMKRMFTWKDIRFREETQRIHRLFSDSASYLSTETRISLRKRPIIPCIRLKLDAHVGLKHT